MSAEGLIVRLGSIQRALIKHLHLLPVDKGVSIVKYTEETLGITDLALRDRYYRAAKLLRERGLVTTSRKGKRSILRLTGNGHAAAYAIIEAEGQNTIPTPIAATPKPIDPIPKSHVRSIPRARASLPDVRPKRAASK